MSSCSHSPYVVSPYHSNEERDTSDPEHADMGGHGYLRFDEGNRTRSVSISGTNLDNECSGAPRSKLTEYPGRPCRLGGDRGEESGCEKQAGEIDAAGRFDSLYTITPLGPSRGSGVI